MALAAVCEEELTKPDAEESLRILIPRAAIGSPELLAAACTKAEGLQVSDDIATYDTVLRTGHGRSGGTRRFRPGSRAGAAADGDVCALYERVDGERASPRQQRGHCDDTEVQRDLHRKTDERGGRCTTACRPGWQRSATIDSLIDKLMEVSGRKSVLL